MGQVLRQYLFGADRRAIFLIFDRSHGSRCTVLLWLTQSWHSSSQKCLQPQPFEKVRELWHKDTYSHDHLPNLDKVCSWVTV
jgi:hypothetical protein